MSMTVNGFAGQLKIERAEKRQPDKLPPDAHKPSDASQKEPMSIKNRVWTNPQRRFDPHAKTFVQFGTDTFVVPGADRVSQHTKYAVSRNGREHNRVLVEPDSDGNTVKELARHGLINDFHYAVSADSVRDPKHIDDLLNAANPRILSPSLRPSLSLLRAAGIKIDPRTYTDMDNHHRILSVENRTRTKMGGVPRFPGVHPPSKTEQEAICEKNNLPVPRSADPKEYTQEGGLAALKEIDAEKGVTKPKGDGCNGLAVSIVTKENIGQKLQQISQVTDYDGASLGGVTIQQYMDPRKYQEGLVVVAADLKGKTHPLAVGQEIVAQSTDGRIRPLIGIRYAPSPKFEKQIKLVREAIELFAAKGTVAFGQFWTDKDRNVILGEADMRILGSHSAVSKIMNKTLQQINMNLQQGKGYVAPKYEAGRASSFMNTDGQQREKLQHLREEKFPSLTMDIMEKPTESVEAKAAGAGSTRLQVYGSEADVEKFAWEAAQILKGANDSVFAPGILKDFHRE